MHDLRPFIATVERAIADHAVAPGRTLAPGAYRRWGRAPSTGEPTLYGCADAANLLYTINAMPTEPQVQAAWIRQLQAFQDPATGLFPAPEHHVLHSTAFILGALDLFEARALHPLIGLAPWSTRAGLRDLLDSLDWTNQPWGESHRGAGVFGSMVLGGCPGVDLDAWQDWYCEWLWENQDPTTGLWRIGCCPAADGTTTGAAPFDFIAGAFHYLFNLDHLRRPLRYTEPLVDTCLALAERGQLPAMGNGLGWVEIDFLYTLRSLQKRTPHRATESRALMERIGERLVRSVLALDPATDPGLDDLHLLFAGVSALAVLQEALPGFIRTTRPLRLVLDRRPFL